MVTNPLIPAQKILAVCEGESFLKELRTSTQGMNPQQWVQDDLQEIHDGLFYREKKLYIPSPELVQKVIYWNHDSALAGHPGIKKTLGNCEK